MKRYDDNLKRIPLTDDYARYVGYWAYIRDQYQRVINAVDRHRDYFIENMTESEFSDAYQFIVEKYEDGQAAVEAALETTHEIYRDIIQHHPFDIDVIDNYVVYNDTGTPINISNTITMWHRADNRSYSDYVTRLYRDTHPIIMEIGGNHVLNVTLQVTDDCNMNCSYCYQHSKGHNRMTFETATQFIDMLLACDARAKGYLNADKALGIVLDFIGGEPFLEIDLIYRISLYFLKELFRRKHHWLEVFVFSATSNGLNYFDEAVQKYITGFGGLVSVGITVDGNKELHDMCRVDLSGKGTYDRAIAAALDFRSHGGDRTKITLSPPNVSYLKDAVIDLIEKGYHGIHANCAFEEGWTVEHARILYRQLVELTDWIESKGLLNTINLSLLDKNHCKPLDPAENRNWCGGNGLMAAVSPDGRIFPCLRFMESSLGDNVEAYSIGDIHHGIGATDTEVRRIDMLREITRRSQSTDECFHCPIASGCAWCTAYNYEVFGTPNARATFICIMHKARALATAYYVRKRYGISILHCPKEFAVPIISEEEYQKLKVFVEGGETNGEC